MRIFVGLLALLHAFSLAACGDDAGADAAMDAQPDTAPVGDAGIDAADSDANVDAAADTGIDAPGDAASDASDAADTGDAGDAGGGMAASGTVSLIVSSAPSTIVAGTFAELPVERLTSNLFGCIEVRRIGDCQFLDCDVSLPTFLEAGTLSVDVAGARLADIDPVSGIYSRFVMASEASPGDIITFTASGAEVAAFTAAVTVADAPGITLPTTIRQADDLMLSWTIGAMGAETLRVALAETGTPSRPIVCEVTAATGSLTVDAALLGELSVGDVTFAVTAYNEASVTAGAFDIVATSGSAVTAGATLE